MGDKSFRNGRVGGPPDDRTVKVDNPVTEPDRPAPARAPAQRRPTPETEIKSRPVVPAAPEQPVEGPRTVLIGAVKSPPAAGAGDAVPTASADVINLVVGWVVIVSGPGTGTSLRLAHGRNAIGRGHGNDVVLPFGDMTISDAAHAYIAYDPRNRRFTLIDGQSRNLTYLDGQPVYQPTDLKGGEVIALGRTELKFVPFAGTYHDWADDAADPDGADSRG